MTLTEVKPLLDSCPAFGDRPSVILRYGADEVRAANRCRNIVSPMHQHGVRNTRKEALGLPDGRRTFDVSTRLESHTSVTERRVSRRGSGDGRHRRRHCKRSPAVERPFHAIRTKRSASAAALACPAGSWSSWPARRSDVSAATAARIAMRRIVSVLTPRACSAMETASEMLRTVGRGRTAALSRITRSRGETTGAATPHCGVALTGSTTPSHERVASLTRVGGAHAGASTPSALRQT
mmetsp:Transcript_11670/g.28853  ORF Transcript_11670/g.28853 Transcript_11670/m.28853 type:complete len:238 (+) Transcript_11670:1004-1717(+)